MGILDTLLDNSDLEPDAEIKPERGTVQPYDYRAPRNWLPDAGKRLRRSASEIELDRLLVRIRVLHPMALNPAQRRLLRDMRRNARVLSEQVRESNPFWRSKLARSRAFGRRIDAVDVPASLFARADIDRVIAIAAGLDPDA